MYNDKIIYGILLKLYFIDRMSILKIDLLTPWQGGPTLKPSASTERTKSGPPPPGCIIKDFWVDDHDDDDDDHHQIYKCLNFFVSQPIFFIFGHMIDMGRARVVMEPDF